MRISMLVISIRRFPRSRWGAAGVLDLLGVTRRGRLVVIELKASEDIQLPIQAVDYWLRVRRHQRDRAISPATAIFQG